jgi:hypothetical protein
MTWPTGSPGSCHRGALADDGLHLPRDHHVQPNDRSRSEYLTARPCPRELPVVTPPLFGTRRGGAVPRQGFWTPSIGWFHTVALAVKVDLARRRHGR